jgi:hypothetical protein
MSRRPLGDRLELAVIMFEQNGLVPLVEGGFTKATGSGAEDVFFEGPEGGPHFIGG